MCPDFANQNVDRPVRTAPFPGIGVGCTTSYVEMRSLATMRIRSPISYISRTLPLAIRGRSATVGMGPQASSGSGGRRGRDRGAVARRRTVQQTAGFRARAPMRSCPGDRSGGAVRQWTDGAKPRPETGSDGVLGELGERVVEVFADDDLPLQPSGAAGTRWGVIRDDLGHRLGAAADHDLLARLGTRHQPREVGLGLANRNGVHTPSA